MLTALLLVAQHHGVHLSREQLVRTYAEGEGEVKRAILVHAADEKGFEARAVRMNWRQLMRLGRAVPAILCLKDGTALVLTGVSPSVSPQSPMFATRTMRIRSARWTRSRWMRSGPATSSW
ncbi:cysteine peptidase family C39 domain-containing protein [Nitrospirillum sp. BR 11163]|uniref:cysteine peptidase family C39 domain-containing protein n=1 Tax=Nitrospirillum sp. BR 11163 TaxID=3104323 RepID=UPI002AFF35E2|nr:cysteine peptidase family C39 domain-containing protein [Nitrospirillum sp. BR 11163]MEA1672154.1 cysteine peptidase family C39 domain-containing protein [Nitrospirillum sp. BR 11163]